MLSKLHVHEDKVALLSDSDSAEEIPDSTVNKLQWTSDPNNIIQVETETNSEAQNDEQTKTDHDTLNGDIDTPPYASKPTCTTERSRGQVLRILSRGSLFVIGLAILVAGGVASNYHPYHVSPGEYENCTTVQLNKTMYM